MKRSHKNGGVNLTPQKTAIKLINFNKLKITKSSKLRARQQSALILLTSQLDGKSNLKDIVRIWKEIYTLEYKLGYNIPGLSK